MLKTVAFISQQSMENHACPHAGTAVISITCPGDEPANIKEGFYSVLRLQFDDLYEEALNEKVGDVPDIGIGGGRVLWHNLTLPDASHARQIIDFVNALAGNDRCPHLIVHCHAGISRSAAVAQFVADKYNAEIDQANPDTSCANARLLRLLNKIDAAGEITCWAFKPNMEACDTKSEVGYALNRFGIF